MLTSQDLITAGIKPGEIFGRCLKCDTLDEALALWEEHKLSMRKISKQVRMVPGSIWHWLCTCSCFENLFSNSGFCIASNSEKRRWIEQGCVLLNGMTNWKPDDKVPEDIWQLVFFQNSNRKCTMI